ncbi:hypothetical protein NE237_019080 [Protea cynaroides]|uniref:Uncharacterized protein n=1 Tax=Protea cynaroides TaxID=273540 RepID=A0A9Q0KBB5_9MAGN|nr:hypothetical protein NE237_019080 [Protea cynaroides]
MKLKSVTKTELKWSCFIKEAEIRKPKWNRNGAVSKLYSQVHIPDERVWAGLKEGVEHGLLKRRWEEVGQLACCGRERVAGRGIAEESGGSSSPRFLPQFWHLH